MGLMKHHLLALAGIFCACVVSEGKGNSATLAESTSESTWGQETASTQGTTSSMTSTAGTSSSGTTSGTSTATNSTTEASSGGSGDGGGEGAACDFFKQDCEQGLKCSPFEAPLCLSEHFECVPIIEPVKQVGERCTLPGGVCGGIDDCDVGLFCAFSDDDGVFGTCVSICDESCGGDNEECIRIGGDVTVCAPHCHPLKNDCDEPHVCAYEGPSFGMVCIAPAPISMGALMPCSSHDDCESGFCGLGVAGCMGWCCSEYCDTGDPLACATIPGAQCEALAFDDLDPDFATLGACV